MLEKNIKNRVFGGGIIPGPAISLERCFERTANGFRNLVKNAGLDFYQILVAFAELNFVKMIVVRVKSRLDRIRQIVFFHFLFQASFQTVSGLQR